MNFEIKSPATEEEFVEALRQASVKARIAGAQMIEFSWSEYCTVRRLYGNPVSKHTTYKHPPRMEFAVSSIINLLNKRKALTSKAL